MNKKNKIIIIAVLFLLVSSVIFFMITIRMSTPQTMNVHQFGNVMGVDSVNKKYTILLLQNDLAFTYENNNADQGRMYKMDEIRPAIMKFSKNQFFFQIKTSPKASYSSTINLLDEMTINNVKNYEIINPTKEEQNLIDKLESGKKHGITQF